MHAQYICPRTIHLCFLSFLSLLQSAESPRVLVPHRVTIWRRVYQMCCNPCPCVSHLDDCPFLASCLWAPS
ncbi:hypothetical protein EDB89DRAFT_902283 [Lactarius sanguifluus]|nr:hypothetical protein EDB89DRAFT_902283 [Lactarius sanguifluus]